MTHANDTVGRYLRDEAAYVERRIARLRIWMILIVGLALAISAFAGGLPGAMTSSVVGLAWLAAAVGLDRGLAGGRYSPWLGLAATLIDALFLTAVVVSIVIVRNDPSFGPNVVHIYLYFPLVALAALRQSRRLAFTAGVVCAICYVGLFAIAAIGAPGSITFGEPVPGQVGVIRTAVIVTALVLTGIIGAVMSSRSQRLLATALDTRTFLFSDLRDFTSFVERNGDAAAAELIRTYRTLVRNEIARAGGGEVKTEGDSFYVVFDSARQALACGVAIQRAAQRTSTAERPIRVGIGIHAGEPVPHDGQFVGSAVNVAARLAQNAAADELIVSDIVRGLVRTSNVPPMEERSVTLKGITEPPRAYLVRWQATD